MTADETARLNNILNACTASTAAVLAAYARLQQLSGAGWREHELAYQEYRTQQQRHDTAWAQLANWKESA